MIDTGSPLAVARRATIRRGSQGADFGEGRLRAARDGELTAAGGGPVKGDRLAGAQSIPARLLENIFSVVRQARLVRSQRGAEGGYWVARRAEDITLAGVVGAVDGPLATARGEHVEDVAHTGAAAALQHVVDRRAGEPAGRLRSA